MYIPGQIRIFNALKSDGYSTGIAPPSGNNGRYSEVPLAVYAHQNKAVLMTRTQNGLKYHHKSAK